MFTGIIEELGRLVHIEQDRGNTHFKIEVNDVSELKIDQSLAHDGCCLTVTNVDENTYEVTLSRTLSCTTLGNWKPNTMINLERCMKMMVDLMVILFKATLIVQQFVRR